MINKDYYLKKLLPKALLGLPVKLLRSVVKRIPKLAIVKADYSVGKKDVLRLKLFFAQLKINGLLYGLEDGNVLVGLPNYVINYLTENTIERNIRAMRNAGYSESEIENYKQHVDDLMHKVRVGLYSGADYAAALSDFGGFYNDNNFFISANKDYAGIPVSRILKHEGRHMLDFRSGMPNELYGYLDDAYDDDFLNLPNLEDAGSLKGYKYMNREKITTNLDSRNQLLSSSIFGVPLNKLAYNLDPFSKVFLDMIEGLNAIILDAYDEEVFNAVRNANGYGRRYIDYLKKNGKLTPEKAELFRKAMMYVGGYALPVAGGISMMLNLDKNNKR